MPQPDDAPRTDGTSTAILVAVAWPYANNHLHVGHLAGAYIPADVFARYHRMRGNGQKAKHIAREVAYHGTTLGALSAEAMADVVDHLADVSARVLVLSGDASLGVARQLVGDLCSLRDGVTVVDGNDVAVRRAVALARQGDVLLVLDLRRYDRWVIDAAKAARQNGVWIVAVTDSLLSPLASLAERTLTVAAAGGGPFDSHVGTLALANVLVAGVADRLRVHAADRLDRTEAAWRAGSSLVER